MPRKIGCAPSDDEGYGDEGYEIPDSNEPLAPLWVETPDYNGDDEDED